MDRKREIFEKVLALVRNELWEEPLGCSVSADDVDEVLRIAHELNVAGMAANAIVRNQLPVGDEGAMQAWGLQKKHEQDHIGMNEEIVFFTDFLDRRDLKYYLMKGQSYGVLYRYPAMRTIGDIDFYCPEENYEHVQQAIEEKLGITMAHNKSEIHDNFDIEGFQFEMHSRLTSFSYHGHQRYWEGLVKRELNASPFSIAINEKQVTTLPPTLNAVYVFAHIMEHFVEKILLLKQLCDWAVLLHANRDEIDRDALERNLSQLGLLKAYRAMGAWLISKLGLPADDFPLALSETDDRWVELLTQDFIYWIERRRQMQKIKGTAAGVRHSLRTAGIVVRQSLHFFRLAPMEMFCRVPSMAVWSFRKRMME